MVGGHIVEIVPCYSVDPIGNVYRSWVLDARTGDELCVYVEKSDIMPRLGDEIWWQSGKVYFNKDKNTLNKVGNSHNPRNV